MQILCFVALFNLHNSIQHTVFRMDDYSCHAVCQCCGQVMGGLDLMVQVEEYRKREKIARAEEKRQVRENDKVSKF